MSNVLIIIILKLTILSIWTFIKKFNIECASMHPAKRFVPSNVIECPLKILRTSWILRNIFERPVNEYILVTDAWNWAKVHYKYKKLCRTLILM